MSRVGRNPIPLPSGVDVTIQEQHVRVKGAKGQLEFDVPMPITVRKEENTLLIERPDDARANRALHGTARAILANMVKGVSEGFTRQLEINGVGYRASVQGDAINFELGYSHPILFDLPKGVSAQVERNTLVTIMGIDKQVLGETAANIRKLRPPEPYKGKGVKYVEETIRRKVGKKNV